MPQRETVEKWDTFELSLDGPADGNPFTDVELTAEFSNNGKTMSTTGFYDGDGTYRVRFMPDTEGTWSYKTASNVSELDDATGSFQCTPPSEGNHGPVHVADTYHFSYADGTPFSNIGTTCYAWAHQSEELKAKTLETLKSAPFNKLRMMLFPKNYTFCKTEPLYHAFEGGCPNEGGDLSRFSPAYFQNLDRCVTALRDLGIEADIIFFTSYDFGRWGYDAMPAEVDDRVIRYTIARLAAYRNVWWSMANEWDLMKEKTPEDWDRFFQITRDSDPYNHLRSNHNANTWYDHGKPWVTHCSIQNHETHQASRVRQTYGKPAVYDECCYEGNVSPIWGNIPGQEMVRRFWMGICNGGYVGHGETYLHPDDVLWWSKGGELHGGSPARLAFLRGIVEEAPVRLDPIDMGWDTIACAGKADEYYLHYMGIAQPQVREVKLPEEGAFTIDVIDTWGMTVERLDGTFSGPTVVDMPGRPYMAIRV